MRTLCSVMMVLSLEQPQSSLVVLHAAWATDTVRACDVSPARLTPPGGTIILSVPCIISHSAAAMSFPHQSA